MDVVDHSTLVSAATNIQPPHCTLDRRVQSVSETETAASAVEQLDLGRGDKMSLPWALEIPRRQIEDYIELRARNRRFVT